MNLKINKKKYFFILPVFFIFNIISIFIENIHDTVIIGFEFLALISTLFAYWQKNREIFIKINAIAISLLALIFLSKGGLSGYFIEYMMLIIHLVALITNEKIEKKLNYINSNIYK